MTTSLLALSRVKSVFLPTYSSWLNSIESEFAILRYFARNGTDHRSNNQQEAAIGAYLRWHDQHARLHDRVRGQLHKPAPRLPAERCSTEQ